MKKDRLIKTILFATDFSSCAERAYQHALYIAYVWGAAVNVLHVVEFQPGMDPEYEVNRLYLDHLRKETDKQLATLVERARRLDVRVVKQEAMGIPSLEINRIALTIEADLVVVGTHGRTGLEHVLLGSTAERVIKGAPCPVLAFREGETTGEGATGSDLPRIVIDRILVPIDFSDCSLDALEYAAQVARQFKARVTILHVMEPVSYGLDFTLSHAADPDRRERIRARLSDLTAALTRSGVETDHVLRGGLPADAIINYERAEAKDLIIMGTHGRRGISHLVNGSVTEAVLRRAHGPVLTVRSPKFVPGHERLVSTGGGQENLSA